MLSIDGRKISQKIIGELKQLPKISKKLAAVFVGDNQASASFLKQKERVAQELGISFALYRFPETIPESELIESIEEISGQVMIGGIIIQLPLPKHFDAKKVLSAITPNKDIDAITSRALVFPLPVGVVQSVLSAADYKLEDKVVAVIGRGVLVGKPIAEWLQGRCREVFVLHRGSDLNTLRRANLIVSGVGKAGLIKSEMISEGAGIIDFGFDLVDGKIRGDLAVEAIKDKSAGGLSFYTPTPGGTGPILVAELFRNFYKLNK